MKKILQKIIDGINNIPLKTNYKNNWNFVKHFVEQKHKENTIHNSLLKNSKINYFKEKNNSFSKNIISNNTNYKTSIPSEIQNFHSDTENIS